MLKAIPSPDFHRPYRTRADRSSHRRLYHRPVSSFGQSGHLRLSPPVHPAVIVDSMGW